MLNTAFAPWPSYTEEEVNAVSAVLRSNRVNYWTGEECRHFEREFARWSECPHAIAVANGTVALDLALHGLGIGAANGGAATDEVIVTPRTFLASVSCVVNAGAVPIFADVDRDNGNLSAVTIAPHVTDRTKAIIVVHLAGWPADMDPIMELAESRDIKVIEDCAQAHGARYKGRSVGSIGHIGAWSFCQDKIMTTGGEGGMVTTGDRDLWSRMWSFKDHGKSWDAVYERSHPPGFRWLHESFGTNWRMLEMQAVLGRIQLGRMAEWTDARTHNARILRKTLLPHSAPDGVLRLPQPAEDGSVHAQYKFYAYVRPEALASGWDRDRIVAEICSAGVPCFQGSCSEVYLETAFDGTGLRPPERLPVARELGETSLMWLVHPTVTDEQIRWAAEISAAVLRRAASAEAG
ncbi:DegT/DnrJ/EryC1/StrS aminotransferase family protein [Pelagerythrobacter marensis]|uniref:DegT/DnrJ/EryC1/StrS aminotransferase family protein n=1 Tax=Pelagerythrobacter marensis TaxID=543877 RepID=A0ABZ2D485_9SPHN